MRQGLEAQGSGATAAAGGLRVRPSRTPAQHLGTPGSAPSLCPTPCGEPDFTYRGHRSPVGFWGPVLWTLCPELMAPPLIGPLTPGTPSPNTWEGHVSPSWSSGCTHRHTDT